MVERATSPGDKATLFSDLPVPVKVDTLLGAVSDFILALSRDGTYVWAAATDPQANRDGQLKAAQARADWLIGKTLFDVFPEADASRLQASVDKAIDSGQKQDVEYWVEPWNGAKRWFEATISRLSEDFVLWVARDVTDLKRTRDDLDLWNKRRLTLINSVDAILWEADVPFTRFTFVSEQAERLLGYPIQRWLEEPGFWTSHMHPDDLAWCPAFCEQKTAANEAHDFEYRMVAADGRVVWLRDIVNVVTEDGVPKLLRGVMVDITALKEKAAQASEQEQQYRAVFEASSDGLVIHSFKEDYPVVTANPAAQRLWGYGASEIVEARVAEMIPDTAAIERFAKSVMETGSGHLRAMGHRLDGSTFEIEAFGTQFMLDGEPHVLCVQRDITEQVRGEQLLEERVEQRTREIETLLQVSQAASSTLDMKSLLEVVMDQLRAVVPCLGSSIGVVRDGALLTLASRVAPQRRTKDAALGVPIPLARLSAIWQVLSNDKEVIIGDVRGDDAMAQAYRQAVGDLFSEDAATFLRSWMAVPLVHKDEVIGVLSVSTDEPDFYTAEHAKLAKGVASQVAAAVANVRLFERVQERSRELESVLEVSRAVASTLDLGQLVRLTLRQLGGVVKYSASSLILLDNDEFVVFDSRGTSDDAEAIGMRFPSDASDEQWRGLLLRSVSARYPCVQAASEPDFWATISRGEHVIVADAARTDVGNPGSLAAKLAIGKGFSAVRSWMAVPLALQDRVIGYLGVANEQPGYFTEEHAQVARAFAAHAAIAIDNARLFSLEQERSRELGTLLEVSRHVASTLELNELLRVVLSAAKEVTQFDRASLSILNGDLLEILSLVGSEDATRGLFVGERISTAAAGRLWEVLATGEAIAVEDITDDSELSRFYRSAVQRGSEGVRSWLGVPLMVRDEVIGMLALARKQLEPFTKEESRLMRAFADQAALAVENARLYSQAQKFAVVEERQRLARELHDSVSQALYGIGLGARTARSLVETDREKAIEPLEYVLQLAEAGLAEMRALIFDLRPESLEEEGLISAVERHLHVMEMRHEIPVETEFGPEPDAPVETKEAVYRIVREGLHNVMKHARATHVHLLLKSGEESIDFRIEDDGTGFDPKGDFRGHMGLISMRERAEACGGWIKISSEPGKGSLVVGSVPVSR